MTNIKEILTDIDPALGSAVIESKEIPATEIIKEHPKYKLGSVTLAELQTYQVPVPDPIIDPILKAGESMIIYARAGVGKTYFALMMAKAISEGTTLFERWKVPKARKVLYVDGEMGSYDMLKRVAYDCKIDNPNFLMRPCDYPPEAPLVNLAERIFQDSVLAEIEETGSSVVFLDNLSTLYKVDGTNQMESWTIMQDFLLDIRRRGVATVLIDHVGKMSSTARGTSAKMDIMHTGIRLEQPPGYDNTQGARFRLTFDKHRGFCGEMAGDVELWFHNGVWDISKPSKSAYSSARGDNNAKPEVKKAFFSYFSEGKTVSQALTEWDIEDPENPVSRKTAYVWFNEWRSLLNS